MNSDESKEMDKNSLLVYIKSEKGAISVKKRGSFVEKLNSFFLDLQNPVLIEDDYSMEEDIVKLSDNVQEIQEKFLSKTKAICLNYRASKVDFNCLGTRF